MSYRLSEAAAACSLNKSTVRRAIKTGKVSATKDAHGQWHIEPAELHRVYPPRTEASTDERIRTYAAEIALLRDRIAYGRVPRMAAGLDRATGPSRGPRRGTGQAAAGLSTAGADLAAASPSMGRRSASTV